LWLIPASHFLFFFQIIYEFMVICGFFFSAVVTGFQPQEMKCSAKFIFSHNFSNSFLITITFIPFLMAVSFYKCFTRDKFSCQCLEHLPRLFAYRGQFHDCPTLPRKTYILPCYIFTCKSTYFRRENCRRMEICYYAYNFIYFEIRYEDSLFSK